MGFYDKLNTVQWDQLYHSYGPAGDVPDLLRDLTSPVKKIRDDARSSLLYSLDHQGVQRWESTAAATPFLLDLLQDPLVADRHLLIPLLTATTSTQVFILMRCAGRKAQKNTATLCFRNAKAAQRISPTVNSCA
jgi:hypothetical protein